MLPRITVLIDEVQSPTGILKTYSRTATVCIALGEVGILAVEDVLSRNSKVAHLPGKRIVRTLLIAAVIASLMTLTAYATGLFGIISRIIKDPGSEIQSGTLSSEAAEVVDSLRNVHHRDYISLSGVTGSPEYQAAAEWLAFKGSYADQKTAEQITEGKTYYARARASYNTENGAANTPYGDVISFVYNSGTAPVVIPGDVNGDGSITAADVTALYDYLLNNDTTNVVNGDQTGDGIITAADVTAVYTILLE